MIEQARDKHPGAAFEVMDARLRARKPFDAIFSNAALHWVLEPEKVIARVQQALRPGGRFVAEFGGRGNVRRSAPHSNSASREVVGRAFASPWYYPSIADYPRSSRRADSR